MTYSPLRLPGTSRCPVASNGDWHQNGNRGVRIDQGPAWRMALIRPPTLPWTSDVARTTNAISGL